MLCQAVLPTVAYAAASSDPAVLTHVARAFGLGRICSATVAGTDDAGQQAPQHVHDGVHCPLCLAHAQPLGLPVATVPVLPPAIPDSPDYLLNASVRVAPPADLPWARGPPCCSGVPPRLHA